MLSKLLAVLRGGNQQNDSVDRSLSSDHVVLHNQMENNDTSIVVEFEYRERTCAKECNKYTVSS